MNSSEERIAYLSSKHISSAFDWLRPSFSESLYCYSFEYNGYDTHKTPLFNLLFDYFKSFWLYSIVEAVRLFACSFIPAIATILK